MARRFLPAEFIEGEIHRKRNEKKTEVFGKSLRHDGLPSESDEANVQKNLQKIIPDGVVDARLVAAKEPFATHNRVFGVETLVEMKT